MEQQKTGIFNTHKRNFKLIDEYKFALGDKLKLKEDYKFFKKGDVFIIKWINTFYGWIIFKETEQLPQEVEKILNLIDIEEFKRLKIINNLN